MVVIDFSALLNNVLTADAQYLPISNTDYSKLLALIPEDEFAYLTIKDNLNKEVIKVTNQCGTLLVERGQGATTAKKFPNKSCIFFEMSEPVIDWKICNLNCCEGDCPCEPVAVQGLTLPAAVVGRPWNGSAVFSGTLPITIAASGFPGWVTTEISANSLSFSGTPTGAGSFSVSVSGANCAGADVATRSGTLTVTATAPTAVPASLSVESIDSTAKKATTRTYKKKVVDTE